MLKSTTDTDEEKTIELIYARTKTEYQVNAAGSTFVIFLQFLF